MKTGRSSSAASKRESKNKDLRFKPQIDERSSQMSSKYKMKKVGRAPDQYDWNKEQQRSHKEWQEKEKRRRREEEMKTCTFKPKTQPYKGRSNTPLEVSKKGFDRYVERSEKESLASSKSFLQPAQQTSSPSEFTLRSSHSRSQRRSR